MIRKYLDALMLVLIVAFILIVLALPCALAWTSHNHWYLVAYIIILPLWVIFKESL